MAKEHLNVRVCGRAEPTIVFVHGFGCALEDWDSQIVELYPSFRCVALDLPGHGSSTALGVPSVVGLASAVNDAKSRYSGSKVILIGHSLGAKVVREAYCQSPDGVVGLVLIDGRLYAGDQDAVVARARDAIEGIGFGPFIERHFSDLFLEGSNTEQRERIIARALKLDPNFGKELYLSAVGWDSLRGTATLKNISVPMLVLQSTYVNLELKRLPIGPGVETTLMQTVKNCVSESEVKVIAESGHFPMLDRPFELSRDIHQFASRLASSRTEA
jgi:pimeloyl-ACP methyl ester carboxylesterase